MLVGRELELGILNARLEKTLAGNGSVLFLTGEAGLGKTTLVHDWWNALNSQSSPRVDIGGDALFLESACSSPIGNVDVGSLEALQPWADIVAQLSDTERAAADERASAEQPPSPRTKFSVKKLVRDALPEWARAVPVVGEMARAAMETSRLVREQRATSVRFDLKKLIHDAAPAWAWALPVVGDVAYAALETARTAGAQRASSPSAANQQQVFQQYANLLSAIAAQRPLVIFLDDLHWADTSSVNLLFFLAKQIADKRILVIGTYRHDDAVTALGGKGHPIIDARKDIVESGRGEEFTLGHLTLDAIHQLLVATFPGYAADNTFEHWLENLSGGNSLFVTQYLRTLEEDGHLNVAGRFDGSYETIAVPRTSLAVVEERTRRLDPATRRLLTYATAEGEEFTSYVLERISEKSSRALLADLTAIEQTGMVRMKGHSRIFANRTTAIFGFSHALFHKALYESLNDVERNVLHRECLNILRHEWDETRGTDLHTPAMGIKLLTHAEKCAEWLLSATIAVEAGRELWNTFAEAESLELAHKALACLDRVSTPADRANDGLRGDAFMLLGQIHQLRGRLDDGIQAYVHAEECYRSAKRITSALDAAVGRSDLTRRVGRFEDAIALAIATETESNAVGYPVGAYSALQCRGLVHWERGQEQEALALGERALALSSATNDDKWANRSHMLIGVVLQSMGRSNESIGHFEICLQAYKANDNRGGLQAALQNIGMAYANVGEYDKALEIYNESMRLARTIGARMSEADVHNAIGNAYLERGEYAAALDHFEKFRIISRETGYRMTEGIALNNISLTLINSGELDRALPVIEESLILRKEIGHTWGIASSLNLLGDFYMDKREYKRAEEHYNKSIEMWESIENSRGLSGTLHNLGVAYRLNGDLPGARAAFTRAMALQEKLDDKISQLNTACELAIVEDREALSYPAEEQRGLRRMACMHLEQATVELETLGSRFAKRNREYLDRIKQELGE